VLRPNENINQKYLGWFFQSKTYRDLVSECSKGSNINNLKRDHVLGVPFPLAPLDEQQRITDKIESLFAELDNGEEALRTTLKQLARYRQSVLKAAVSGELTADWREENADKLEHGRDLLAKILQKRREQWQGRGKYKEPMKADVSGLPDLPKGWVWASLDQLVGTLKNGLSGKPSQDVNQFPILRISSTRPMKVSMEDMRYYQPRSGEDVDQFWVEKGDLLFTRYNGSAHLVGVCGQMRSETNVLHPDKLIRARPMWTAGLITDYLEIACNTGATRKHIAANIKTTSGQQGLAGSDLRVSPIPLPPAGEQAEIAARVWRALGDMDMLQAHCQSELSRTSALRQSILKNAFSGKLVPQDPNDEPASELLKRIKTKAKGN
jgi:type I restriction enzyme S subunit